MEAWLMNFRGDSILFMTLGNARRTNDLPGVYLWCIGSRNVDLYGRSQSLGWQFSMERQE